MQYEQEKKEEREVGGWHQPAGGHEQLGRVGIAHLGLGNMLSTFSNTAAQIDQAMKGQALRTEAAREGRHSGDRRMGNRYTIDKQA